MTNENKSNVYIITTVCAFVCLFFMHWGIVLTLYVIILSLIPSWVEKDKEKVVEENKEKRRNESFQNIELKDNFKPTITFTIGREHDYDNKSIKWHKKDEVVNVNGIEIKGGLFYTSETEVSLSSVISKNLSISNNIGYVGQLGYWPSYSRLTPEQRTVYLTWLANGRKGPIDIGYVFIFFYGLEYRYFEDILKDKKLEKEIPDIIKETEKLLKIYRNSNSFNGYANRFLEFVKISSKSYQAPAIEYFDLFNNKNIWEMPFSVRIKLGQIIANKQPIPAGLALLWLKYSLVWNSRTPARRCRQEFYDLFIEKYTELYGDGIIVTSKFRGIQLYYRPASQDISYENNNMTLSDIADVEKITSQLGKLAFIAEKITNDLDLYSRFIGPENTGPVQEAGLYLPSNLRNKKFTKNILNIKKKYAGKPSVKCIELLSDLGLDRITSKKSIPLIKELLKDNGLIIVENKFGLDDTITIIISDKDIDTDAKDLELPKAVIQTVGYILSNGIKYDKNAISSDGFISSLHSGSSEQAYLKSVFISSINSDQNKASLRGIIKNIKNVDTFIETVIYGLSTLVPITSAVTKELETVSQMVGFESKEFHSLLYRAQNKQVGLLAKSKKGLDSEKIKKLKKESAEISKRLNDEVFNDPDYKTMQKNKPNKKSKSALGLSQKQEDFFQEIKDQSEWDINEITKKAVKYNLMLEGVLEEINEKVYDLKNVTPIDIDGDSVYIDVEILKDIK